jgi:transglutaminase-like putative cysteine protease
MKYRILHKTDYRYSEPASLSQNELFLLPRQTATQRVSGGYRSKQYHRPGNHHTRNYH